jgi:hypothetical protein
MEKVMYVLLLTRNGFGYVWGGFFTNSSGHPAKNALVNRSTKQKIVEVLYTQLCM